MMMIVVEEEDEEEERDCLEGEEGGSGISVESAEEAEVESTPKKDPEPKAFEPETAQANACAVSY